jgi:transcriptional regulator with XRE-family HTH domain
METPEMIYKYFEMALNYVFYGPNPLERKAVSSTAGISVQYLSQILSPSNPKRASIKSQKKIAEAAGYSYDEFLQRGKYILFYGVPVVGSQRLNQLYERIEQIMKSLKLNKEQLILKSQISTQIQSGWPFIGDPPDPDDIEKIANATGYSKTWILTGRGPLLSDKKTIPINDHRKPEDLPHEKIITRFKNKEWARRMNAILLVIEGDPKKRESSEMILKALADQVLAKKKPERENGGV